LRISWSDFERDVLPSLTSSDLVLFINLDDDGNDAMSDIFDLLGKVTNTPADLCSLLVSCRLQPETRLRTFLKGVSRVCSIVEIPLLNILPGVSAFGELAAKLALNAISTYAHVSIGKVFKNRMIDLSVSNTKLFHRSISIISELAAVPLDEAKKSLLKSIHLVDDIPEVISEHPISRHVQVASCRSRVVPLAIILASSSGMTVKQAIGKLNAQPIVRKLIAEREEGNKWGAGS